MIIWTVIDVSLFGIIQCSLIDLCIVHKHLNSSFIPIFNQNDHKGIEPQNLQIVRPKRLAPEKRAFHLNRI